MSAEDLASDWLRTLCILFEVELLLKFCEVGLFPFISVIIDALRNFYNLPKVTEFAMYWMRIQIQVCLRWCWIKGAGALWGAAWWIAEKARVWGCRGRFYASQMKGTGRDYQLTLGEKIRDDFWETNFTISAGKNLQILNCYSVEKFLSPLRKKISKTQSSWGEGKETSRL